MGFVWVALLALSVVTAALHGRMSALTASIATSAGAAVTLALGLAGVMALWLGLVRVAEEAGLVRLLARALRPVLRRLFPEVPADHPALGAVVMNVAANLFGLGNAATPFGLKAMKELDRLNPHPGTATDAQVLLCALNTASLQLVPATVIALRASAGARSPADVLAPTLVATLCAAAVAVAAAKLLRRAYPAPPPGPARTDSPSSTPDDPPREARG